MAKSLTVAACVAWQFFMQPGPGIVNTALLLTGAGVGGGKLGAAGGVAVTTTVTVPTLARVVVVVPFTVVALVLEEAMVPSVTVQIEGEVAVQQLPLEQELVFPTPAVELIWEIVEFGESVSVKIAPLTGSPWL